MRFHPHALLLALALLAPTPGQAAEPLTALVRMLGATRDPAVQVDMLRGLRDATQGRPSLPMPTGWEPVEARLIASDNLEIRALATSLGLTFGSPTALATLRTTLGNASAPTTQRLEALRALLGVRDATLPPTLQRLLTDPALRGAAARALATFDDPATAPALLSAYASLAGGERRDALTTLSSRPAYARALLAAVASGTVPPKDLTAEVVRQLRNLKDDQVNTRLTQVYGTIRDVPADKQADIEKYKRIFRAGGSTPGDAIRGRAVYAKVCQQCHHLFDTGGQVGPDLTGANRGDLDYLLQNIIDPNAVIPNEYQASTLELKDGRVVTGIVKQQDDRSVVVATANESVRLTRSDIVETQLSQLSMMPEGLVAPLADQEFRDLIYYLSRPSQSPMLATTDTANLFFSGADLSLWHGDEATWSVANGEISARADAVQSENRHLRSDLVAGDFRLVLQFQLQTRNAAGSVVFRAEPTPDGGVRGYAIGITPDAWATLSEEGGRGVLRQANGPSPALATGWNTLEVLAIGSRIRTAINGKAAVDLDDPAGARQGLVARRLPTGGRVEARFKDLRLEPNPKPEFTTVKP
jgi:putative heme-binding domain-containing protein